MCLADSSARPPRQVRCSGDTLRAASRRRESDPASVALDLCRWPRRQCGQLPRREFLSERSGWSDGRCRPQLFGLIVTGAKESIPAKLGSGRKYLSTRLLMQRRVLKRLNKGVYAVANCRSECFLGASDDRASLIVTETALPPPAARHGQTALGSV